MLSRLTPDGLAARFIVLLAAALIVANVIALLLLIAERAQLGRAAREEQAIERIIALVPALEAVEPVVRDAISHDVSSKAARIDVDAAAIVDGSRQDARSMALAARLADALTPREVRVAILAPGRDEDRIDRRAHPGDRQSEQLEHEIIAVSIALNVQSDLSGQAYWLNVTARAGNWPSGIRRGMFLFFLTVSLASVLGVGLVFVRRLTTPLSKLATAAQAAGLGDRTARVPERGAREMREVAAAFNAMQARIARFEAERTRTVAAVGHDLRTPITSLRIRAEMLDEAVREPMVRTLEEMTVMCDGLIAWSRDQNDQEERQTVQLEALLKRLCGERGATFESACAARVSAQPVALSRAIGNLIDNALRYGTTARVRLSSCATGEPHDCAEVRIQDNGPGIAQERFDDVFEPFVRGEQSRSSETGGAGLGLSIARSIVQAHGGSIELENTPGGGLTATITLPVVN